MGNMSYCRFRNTLGDLEDCYENMEQNDLGEDEARARIQLIKLCAQIAGDYEGDIEWMEEGLRRLKEV
jgi:hypothetical protein